MLAVTRREKVKDGIQNVSTGIYLQASFKRICRHPEKDTDARAAFARDDAKVYGSHYRVLSGVEADGIHK